MIKTLILLTLFLFAFPTQAQAYLDPGTGSYITQVLIGFAVGGSYLLKIYWNQAKEYIQEFKEKRKKTNEKKDN
jgi:hypothetical protein